MSNYWINHLTLSSLKEQWIDPWCEKISDIAKNHWLYRNIMKAAEGLEAQANQTKYYFEVNDEPLAGFGSVLLVNDETDEIVDTVSVWVS